MENLEEKTNGELEMELKNIQQEHESLKTKMLNDFTRMEIIEKRFIEIKQIKDKRLKRNE